MALVHLAALDAALDHSVGAVLLDVQLHLLLRQVRTALQLARQLPPHAVVGLSREQEQRRKSLLSLGHR